MLKKALALAALLAAASNLIEAISAVLLVPIFAPTTIATAPSRLNKFCCAKMMIKPVTTELDCRIAVIKAPTKMPMNILSLRLNQYSRFSS